MNVSDEKDVQTPRMPNNFKKQTFVFGVKINCNWLLCLLCVEAKNDCGSNGN